jgi:glycosyltransferase involved in cell wall biosynthesis
MGSSAPRITPRPSLDGLLVGIDSHGAEDEGEGNATYTRHLISELFRADGADDFALFARNPAHPFYRSLPPRGRSRVIRTIQGRGLGRVGWTLGRDAARERVDALHVQYFAPLRHRERLVATVHDLAFLHLPESFPPGLRLAMRTLIPRTIRLASRIVTGSEFSRRDIEARYPASRGKITVIPQGVDTRFHPRSAEETRAVLGRYGLEPGFLFSVGRLNLRKNLARLLRAYERMRDHGTAAVPLVVSGKPDYGHDETPPAGWTVAPMVGVRWMGLIPDEDLPAFYSGAAVFIYPSLFEGFGLPVLEAMACGTPVVASDRASLPELTGDASLLVDAESVDALAEAIARVVADQSLAQDLRRRGLERSRRFSWKETASRTLAVYREVCQSGPR